MNDSTNHFRLNSRGLMLALISAAFAHPALANSGKVDFAAGNVTATGADRQPRTLVKGAEVKSGDSIVTTDGRAQIRFSDGSYVSLQPNTQFDIKEFVYDGKTDGSESAIFSLFKGALRTVTGLVGRVHRDRYKIATPTATIGIRGTGGVIQVGADGSTLVLGTSGVWTLTNNGGSLDIPAGTSGFSGPNQSQPPQQSTQAPSLPPPPPVPPSTYTQGDNRNSTGTQTDILPIDTPPPVFTPLVTGPGYAIAYVGAEGGFINKLAVPRTATFNGVGMMTSFGTQQSALNTYTLAGTHAEFATADGVLAWGRWTGPVNISGCCTSSNFNDNQGLHYVVGIPTPTASLPTQNITYTYNMIGNTKPTATNGSVAPGTLTSAKVMGNFSTNQFSALFAGNIGGKTFDATVNGMSFDRGTATFSGSSSSYLGSLKSICGSASVNGFFAGNGATHAGFTYLLSGTTLGSNVVGAVALKR